MPSVSTPAEPLRVVVLVSGSGTNLQALLDAQSDSDPTDPMGYAVVAVGAHRAGTRGEERAAAHVHRDEVGDLLHFASREEWDRALLDQVRAHTPDLVVLAGFMKLIGPDLLREFPTVNSHPALLPSFPGAHGVRDALAHGVAVTGCTIFWVDEGVDTGTIIDQRAVRVEAGDTEETLHERIKVEERVMFVETVRALAADRTSWLT
ncbi:MAG: phosphoribosylglycinamide formyltransferase [Actinomycetia bacterium]|nr:phosphoribosylglycinamide formyltransferase [Actinomycetes bacterium]